MKKFFYSFLNNISVAFAFIIATKIADSNIAYGIIAWFIAYFILDHHSYIDKKLNYPNNFFIKH